MNTYENPFPYCNVSRILYSVSEPLDINLSGRKRGSSSIKDIFRQAVAIFIIALSAAPTLNLPGNSNKAQKTSPAPPPAWYEVLH
jgi:hypothetical protein